MTGTPTARLPLNALRAFEVAARHESYVAAAEELGVSPGAVSQQVKRLEQYLGYKLFHRLAHGVELTDTARTMWPIVSDALTDLEAAVQQLKSAK